MLLYSAVPFSDMSDIYIYYIYVELYTTMFVWFICFHLVVYKYVA